ncbi:MAG TPA: hypothetical protein VGO91_12885 [Pyrinomonadaceae bacterium]|nr:hypothetical protein [Pyrinomonadaceae bacterium]
MPEALRIILLLALISCGAGFSLAQEKIVESVGETPGGSLWEIRDKQRVLLLVGRSNIIDCRDMAQSILAEAARPENKTYRGHAEAYETIERRLNAYISKYKSLSMAEDLPSADFIVVFNVLQMRRNVTPQFGPLPEPLYPFGEMFVIVNEAPARPRIIWKSKRELMWVKDAIGDLINELKIVRGEK